MKSLSPYSVIMAVNLEPIYSIVLALLLFGESEQMTPSFYIGASIIIRTVFFDGYLKTKQKSVTSIVYFRYEFIFLLFKLN